MMRRRSTVLGLAAVVIGMVAVIVAVILAPRPTAAAWLFALILVMSASAGALTLLMTGRLTGGVWIETLAPFLTPLARAIPFVGLAFIPLLFFLPEIFPWAAKGAEDASVGAIYLNDWSVIIRLAIAFVGWSVIAYLLLPLPGSAGQIAAGAGLVFHIVIVTLLSYDWILALQPKLTSSVFGAHVSILFFMTALALGALFGPLPSGKPSKDVAGLLIACILGTIYMDYMQYLIIWYGDQKDTAQLYLHRADIAPRATIIAAFILGGVIPLAMMMSEEARKSPEIVRGAALFVLIGIGLHWAWSILGLFEAVAVPIALGAALAVVGGFVLVAGTARRRLDAGEQR